jgi:hypothetical protein
MFQITELVEPVLDTTVEAGPGFWDILTEIPLSDMTGVQVLLLGAILWVSFGVVKSLFSPAKQGAAILQDTAKSILHPYKAAASKTVCLHCGRTLDKCVCPTNKGVSLRNRLKKHKQELKIIKLQKKAAKLK